MDQYTPTPTPQARARPNSQLLQSSGHGKREGTAESSPVHCNVRTMSTKELEIFFRELAPLAKNHCSSKTYCEDLTAQCRAYMARYNERPLPQPVPSDTPEGSRFAVSIQAVWLFARAHITRHPHLRETPEYRAHAKNAEQILQKWMDDTNTFLEDIQAKGVTALQGGVHLVIPPTADMWRDAHQMLHMVLRHASYDSRDETPELKYLCQSLSTEFCAYDKGRGSYLTEQWLNTTHGLDAFRYTLQCNRGRLFDAQWSTGTWSHAGHAWHPEMSDLSFLILKDLAVPMPWRGLGFKRLLRELERILALQSAEIGVHGLFVHYVHRDMLALTLGSGMHGYRFWADPCASKEPGDARYLEALDAAAIESIRDNNAERRAKPWMFAFTEHYGAPPVMGEMFHLVWLTPLGERRAAAQTRPLHRVLVPLGLLDAHITRASMFISDYVHGLDTHSKSPWHSTILETGTSEAKTEANTTSLRLSVAGNVLKESGPWSLTVDVVPVMHPFSGKVVDANTYTMFLAFLGEFVHCLCDTLVYAERDLMTQPPALIQLMIRLTDTHYERDSSELHADLRDLFGNDFVCAQRGTRAGVAAYFIHNKQTRSQPIV